MPQTATLVVPDLTVDLNQYIIPIIAMILNMVNANLPVTPPSSSPKAIPGFSVK
jgi:hypothetical protein